MVAPEPYACPTINSRILTQYRFLLTMDKRVVAGTKGVITAELRSWIREADKACRANSQLLKDTTK